VKQPLPRAFGSITGWRNYGFGPSSVVSSDNNTAVVGLGAVSALFAVNQLTQVTA
jgi:hypothetical protein